MTLRITGLSLALALTVACSGGDDDKSDTEASDTEATSDTEEGTDTEDDTEDTEVEAEQTTIAVATSDYSVGALATISLADWSLTDEITTLASDSALLAKEGWLLNLNRSSADSVRIYEPGDWDEPVLEFSVGEGNNPQDAEFCGGAMFVSLYDTDYLGVYDYTTGTLQGTVDLAEFDDGDGFPETASMVVLDDTLYVAMNQLDQDNYWVANGGVVAEVDCDTMTVTDSWEVGNNPSIVAYPGESKLLVKTGAWYSVDGGVSVLDPAAGTQSELYIDEADLEADVALLNATGDHAMVASSDASGNYTAWCVDLTDWSTTEAFTTASYLAGIAVTDDGHALVAGRSGWGDAETTTTGVGVFDLSDCSEVGWVDLSLEPSSMAVY